MASIIEKKRSEAERHTIAGVFENRLRKGMKLQRTDDLVCYRILTATSRVKTCVNLRRIIPIPLSVCLLHRSPCHQQHLLKPRLSLSNMTSCILSPVETVDIGLPRLTRVIKKMFSSICASVGVLNEFCGH